MALSLLRLSELAVAALVNVPGSCADQDLITMLAADACQTPAEQWALGLLLASAQVGQAADTLMPIVGTARASELLLQWAKTFEAELPLLEEWTEEPDEESFMPARLALKQDVIEAVGDACEAKAMDLVQQGYIRMPSWTASDFGALASPEEDEELRGRLAAWFLSGLTQKLAHCYDCCGVLMRMQAREQTQSLAATVEATLSACRQLREMVLESSDLAEQPAKLHLALPVVNRTEAPGDGLGEEFVSVIATALDSAFRRVEAQIPSLLLRPLWRLATAKEIWIKWAKMVAQQAPPRDRSVDQASGPNTGPEAAVAKEATKPRPERPAGKAKAPPKRSDRQDWNARSRAMLAQMGWTS